MISVSPLSFAFTWAQELLCWEFASINLPSSYSWTSVHLHCFSSLHHSKLPPKINEQASLFSRCLLGIRKHFEGGLNPFKACKKCRRSIWMTWCQWGWSWGSFMGSESFVSATVFCIKLETLQSVSTTQHFQGMLTFIPQLKQETSIIEPNAENHWKTVWNLDACKCPDIKKCIWVVVYSFNSCWFVFCLFLQKHWARNLF